MTTTLGSILPVLVLAGAVLWLVRSRHDGARHQPTNYRRGSR